MSTLKTNRIEPVGSTAGTVTVDGTMVFAQGATFPGGISVGQFAYFSSGVTVANTGSFGGLLTLAGATSSAVLSCSTAPTLGQHLANKDYVDTEVAWYNKTYSATNPPIGTIIIVSINDVFNGSSSTSGTVLGNIGATFTGNLRVNGTSNSNRYVYGTTPSGSSAVSGTWRIICHMDDDGGASDHAWVMLVRIS